MTTLEATPILIGRNDECHVKLDKLVELAVSGQHAQIDRVRDGVYSLTNLSRNGTFLNGTLVEQEVPLPNHTVIQLGRDGPRLRFDVDENVAGISFQAAKEKAKTGKMERGRLGPAPDTEERPAFRIDDTVDSSKKSGGSFGVPVFLLLGLAVIALIGGGLWAILRH